MRVAAKYKLYDSPDDPRKIHTAAIPRLGGIAIIIGSLIPIIMWARPFDETILSFVLSSIILLGFGIWDDLKTLNFKTKFLGQLLAIAVVVFYGDIVVTKIPLYESEMISNWIAYPLTIVCLLAITNAINLVDGLDGLAGGTSLLSFGVIAVIAFLSEGDSTIIVTLAVMGGVLGFLRFNTHPATIFMGDSGSQYLGFILGCLAILLTQQTNTAVSPAIVFFILGLPIIDTLSVMAHRFSEKKSLFSPDNNHLHHKLLETGFDHYEAVFIIYFFQAIFISIAYLGRYESDLALVFLYLAFCITSLMSFKISSKWHWQIPKTFGNRTHYLQRKIKHIRSSYFLNVLPVYIITASIILLVILALFVVPSIPYFLGASALVLSIGLVFQHFFKILGEGLFERICFYFLGIFAIFAFESIANDQTYIIEIVNYFIVFIAVTVVIGVKLAKYGNFSVTPLDFLIVFVIITVPNIAAISGEEVGEIHKFNFGEFAVKMVIIFYGVELIFATLAKSIKYLRFAILVLMVTIGLLSL